MWLLAGAALCGAASAQTSVNLIHDNDEWAHTDEEYTEGTRLAVVSYGWGQSERVQALARALPGIEPGEGLSAGIAAGVDLYAPRTIAATTALPRERAYAGYLHLDALMESETAIRPGLGRLDRWRLEAGVVGPAAQGEALVTFFHAAFSGRDMNGWDNQIRNRLGLEAGWERRWRNVMPLAGGLEADVSPAIGFEAGTVSLAASGGLMLRLGFGLEDDFGPVRARALGGALARRDSGVSAYVFASATGEASAYDVFVDEAGGRSGDALRGGSAIAREAWRRETSIGVVVNLGRARAQFAWTDQSKLYEQQGGPHQFGEVTLGWVF